MIVRILLTLVVSSCLYPVYSQGLRGRITDELGEGLPFANIYVQQLSTGTTSNGEGYYELKLPPGSWEVLFQSLGYQSQTRSLETGQGWVEQNVQLRIQQYRIPEVRVLASGEDPAYHIMRRAIALAPYYQRQVSRYSSKVYLKGSGVFEKIPRLLRKQMKQSGVKENEPFVMETVSLIDFELPDKLTQRVLAMRSTGRQNNTSPMGMITNNLYDADRYGVVSPLGKSALRVYSFRLEGVFEDKGRLINKIRVIPKIKGTDVFSGTLFIAEGSWNIHSADLTLHSPMADVRARQLYAEVNHRVWMPVSFDFDMAVGVLGLKMNYKYVAAVSDYKTTLNPDLDHSIVERQEREQQPDPQEPAGSRQVVEQAPATKQQQRMATLLEKPDLGNREARQLTRLVESEARRGSPPEPLEIQSQIKVSQKQVNNDTVYWQTLRPIPLTGGEKESFARKDSFLRVSSTPAYKDSVRRERRAFKPRHLATGKRYNYSVDSVYQMEHFSIPGLLNPGALSFNSVDGLRLEFPFSYTRSDSTGRSWSLAPLVGYAFAREKVDASLAYSRRLDGMTNRWVHLSLGSTTEDYNRTTGLSRITNDLYTLWREENLSRYYRRDFVQLGASGDLANGLNLEGKVEFNDNRALTNHSSYTVIDRENREIQPNIPINNEIGTQLPDPITFRPWQLDNHRSLITRWQLEYTPRHRYRVRNHVKEYAGSRYPTFRLGYTGAFSGVGGSDARFDLVKGGLRQRVDLGLGDQLSYRVELGHFLNRSRLYFEDFNHFNVQSTNFLVGSYTHSFRQLPFYQYSTGRQFAEANVEWQVRRLIVKHLPLIKNSSASERLFVNYLSTPSLSNYVELGYGISNLFLLVNVEAVAGFEGGKFMSSGIKVSLNLK